MNEDKTSLDELVEQTQDLLQQVAEISTSLDEIDHGSSEFTSIKQQATGSLVASWTQLTGTFSPETREQLEALLNQISVFTSQFRQVVLYPKRSKFQVSLKQWLSKWVEVDVSWELYIQDAPDDLLDDLQSKIDLLIQYELLHPDIVSLLKKWIIYQCKQLSKQEKSSALLLEWILEISQNFEEAQDLDQFTEEVGDSIQKENRLLLKNLLRKWEGILITNLRKIVSNQEDLGLAEFLEERSSDWEVIQEMLRVFGITLNLFDTPEETHLIERQIEKWTSVGKDEIEQLNQLLGKINEQKRQILEIKPRLSLDEKFTQEQAGPFTSLVRKRPAELSMRVVRSLSEYFSKLEDRLEKLQDWNRLFQREKGILKQRAERWLGLAKEYEIEPAELPGLVEAISVETVGLMEAIQVYSKLLSIEKLIKEKLQAGLSEDERTVHEIVLNYLTADLEKMSLGDVIREAKKKRIKKPEQVLLGLANRNLIRVEVTI